MSHPECFGRRINSVIHDVSEVTEKISDFLCHFTHIMYNGIYPYEPSGFFDFVGIFLAATPSVRVRSVVGGESGHEGLRPSCPLSPPTTLLTLTDEAPQALRRASPVYSIVRET